MASTSKILVVCTANVCRSPLVAIELADALSRHRWLSQVQVVDAGVRTREGTPMCELSSSRLNESLRQKGAAHRSSQLTRDALEGADLVVTLERDHRSSLAQLSPSTRAHTFTVREAIALAEGAVELGRAPLGSTLADLSLGLNSLRGLVPIPTTVKRFGRAPVDALTIPDGHWLSNREHGKAVTSVEAAAQRLAAALIAIAS